MPKATKRERQRQNKEARRAAMLEEEKRRKRLRTFRNVGLLLIPLVIIFVILQVTNSDDSKISNTKPTYAATLDTSEGKIVIGLDDKKYPTSVANFVKLAKQGFYNGLLFNRVAKDFVIQTGSPDNTTSGGPGYTIVGEVPTSTPPYPVGAVAFAKTGSEPPGTAGSQFFIVTGSQGTSLSADYAGIGHVTSGLDVAKKIGTFYPSGGDGTPTKKVTIKKVTISGKPSASATTASTAATTTTVAPTTSTP